MGESENFSQEGKKLSNIFQILHTLSEFLCIYAGEIFSRIFSSLLYHNGLIKIWTLKKSCKREKIYSDNFPFLQVFEERHWVNNAENYPVFFSLSPSYTILKWFPFTEKFTYKKFSNFACDCRMPLNEHCRTFFSKDFFFIFHSFRTLFVLRKRKTCQCYMWWNAALNKL